jgi:hypothetical protein
MGKKLVLPLCVCVVALVVKVVLCVCICICVSLSVCFWLGVRICEGVCAKVFERGALVAELADFPA